MIIYIQINAEIEGYNLTTIKAIVIPIHIFDVLIDPKSSSSVPNAYSISYTCKGCCIYPINTSPDCSKNTTSVA